MTGAPDWSKLLQVAIVLDEHTLTARVRSGTDDVHIASEVVSNAFYRAARALLDEDSIVVDVGAHIGLFSLCATTRGARVVALEPVPGNFRLLTDNIELNKLQSRVKGRQVALWSTNGVRSMEVAHDSTGGSGFWYHQSPQPPINVPCQRLDELMAAEQIPFCHLLKLDCEGAEFEILSTLLPATWERIGAVLLEYHLWAGYTLSQLRELLETKGFLTSVGSSSDPSYGYILAVRVPDRFSALKALAVTEIDSPLTRVPLWGLFWRALRRPAHRLVVYYLNQMIARQNRQNEKMSVYLGVMAAQVGQSHRSETLPFSIALPETPQSPPRFERRLCKVCNMEDWRGEDWLSILDEIGLGYQRNENVRHRKAWEWVQGLYGLKRLGFLHDNVRALGVGAGKEPILYYLANHVGQVVATDIYGEGDFKSSTAAQDMLTNPEKYAPFAYHHDRLSVRHMDGRKLDFEPDSFDVVFSFSSIEHLGGHSAAAKAIQEMKRVLRPGGIVVITTELILNGHEHPEYFVPKQIISELVDGSGLRLVEDIDFSISDRSLRQWVDWQTDDILTKTPLIICRYQDIVWTSVILFLEKP